MQVLKAIFDGYEIKLIEPIKTKKKTEVLVIFPNEVEKIPFAEARKLLKGCGKGERLTEKLLRSRAEDIHFEKR